MKNGFKHYWNEMTSYITKEQTFLLGIYFAFTAYLKNNKIGTLMEQEETGEVQDLKQLREIFKKIPGYNVKVAVNDFEESIGWKIFENQPSCHVIARNFKKKMDFTIQTIDDLEDVIEELNHLVGELDNLMFTPKRVNIVIAKLLMNSKVSEIAEFYSGLSGTGIQIWECLQKKNHNAVSLIAQEQRKLYCDIAQIRMYCHGINSFEVMRKDITVSKDEKTYDLIVADLPKRNNENIYVGNKVDFFEGEENIYAEWFFIQSILQRLNEHGKAIVIVTKGALVRQLEENMRASLAEKDWLEAVITLPTNIYTTTRLGFEILVLNKNKNIKNKKRVFFADLSQYTVRNKSHQDISKEGIAKITQAYENLEEHEYFSTVVSIKDIQAQDYSWNPFLYLRLQNLNNQWDKTVELGEIAQISKGVQLTPEEEKFLQEDGTHYWLNIRHINEQGLLLKDVTRLRAKNYNWEEKFGIREDDIILTSKVTVLQVSIIEPHPPKAFICSNLTRIRVNKEKYSPYILYEFLCSKEGKALLESIQTGTTIKVLSNKNLMKMKIPNYDNVVAIGEKMKQSYLTYRKEKRILEENFEKYKQTVLKELSNKEMN